VQVERIALEQRPAAGALSALGRPACRMRSVCQQAEAVSSHSYSVDLAPLPTVSLVISNGSSFTYLPASRLAVTPVRWRATNTSGQVVSSRLSGVTRAGPRTRKVDDPHPIEQAQHEFLSPGRPRMISVSNALSLSLSTHTHTHTASGQCAILRECVGQCSSRRGSRCASHCW
jgi:hypothetical protein